MKVKELIEGLQTLDPELPVYKCAFSGEYKEVKKEHWGYEDLMQHKNLIDGPYVVAKDNRIWGKKNMAKEFDEPFLALVIY